MQEYYFFRDICNYDELKKKTEEAKQRKSFNLNIVNISKTLILECEEFGEIVGNLKVNRRIIFENIKNMTIKNGIWYCIEITDGKRGILIMSNGYQYPRFTALL